MSLEKRCEEDSGCAKRIEQLYEEQGFLGTSVRIKTDYHGEGGRLVAVTLRVKEGEQPPMGQVLITGNTSYPYWRVADVFSTGERIDILRDTFGIFGYGKYARKKLKTEVLELEEHIVMKGIMERRSALILERCARWLNSPEDSDFEGPRVELYEGNRSLSDSALDAC